MDIVLLDETTLRCEKQLFRCVIGKEGFVIADEKREGDHKTPCGRYPLRACYWRPDKLAKPPQTALPLVEIRSDMGWCDDPEHARYNQLVRVPPPACGGRLGGGKYEALFGEGDFSTRRQKIMENARNLRKNATDAEQMLWGLLRAKQLGFKFRRQHNIGPYIADFASIEGQLIIELDGSQHMEQKPYDEKREAYLREAGFKVLRFWNNEVFEKTEGVLERIWESIHSPTPTLPRRRGRELSIMSVSLAEQADNGTIPPPACGGRLGGGKQITPFSFENLWREDDCYDLIVPIGYNDDPIVAGRGSAIFIHIAKPDFSGTEGCVALAKEDMLALLSLLTPDSYILTNV